MYHLDWWASAFLLLFGAWVVYVVVRPVRDYYVLQRQGAMARRGAGARRLLMYITTASTIT